MQTERMRAYGLELEDEEEPGGREATSELTRVSVKEEEDKKKIVSDMQGRMTGEDVRRGRTYLCIRAREASRGPATEDHPRGSHGTLVHG